MNLDNAFPSKYLKAADIPNGGQTFTIRDIKMEEIGRDGDRKPIFYFENEERGFVCNKTNKNTIKKLFGTAESDQLRGKEIKLVSMEVAFGDEMVESIRVSLRTGPPAQKAKLADWENEVEADSGIPF